MAEMIFPTLSPDDEARFWKKILKAGDCWTWTDTLNQQGYGAFMLRIDGKQKRYRATHIALAMDGRPRADDTHMALHSCDNPSCVNPAHLRWGTIVENTEDAVERKRMKRALSPEQVAHVRQSSLADRELAAQLGVFTSTIWAIRNGKTYRHI